jgi:hypothetical protein
LSDWKFAQTTPAQRLAHVEHFSLTKQNPDGREIEFLITVREYITPRDPMLKFYATSDLQTNQKTMAFTPCGWGDTSLAALSECIRAIERFAYEGE